MRFLPLAITLAGVLGGVAGCTGSSEPPVAQDPIATMEPSVASPSPTPTLLPGERTVAGAERFVRAYLTESNRAYATGDVAALEASSGEECGTCKRILSSITTTYTPGGHFEGGKLTIVTVANFATDLKPPVRINAITESAAGTVVSSEGKILERIPAEPRGGLMVMLSWNHDQWQVTEIRDLGTL